MAKANGSPPPILCISDTHCGSSSGICPPGLRNSNGNEMMLNPPQQWLWEKWEEFMRDVVKPLGKGFTLVLNGDLIDGIHHRCIEFMSGDPGDHVYIAKMLLDPIVKQAGKVYVVTGTESHVKNSEAGLARAFDAIPNEADGLPVHHRLTLPYGGGITRFVHHIGASSVLGLYGTQLSRQLEQHQAMAARMGHTVPNVLVCGHRHTFGYYCDGLAMCLTLPPWQMMTRFVHRVIPGAHVRVGAVVLYYTNNDPIPHPVAFTRTVER